MQTMRLNRNAGMALIAVLGVLALLTVIALTVTDSTRRHGHLATRSFEAIQAAEIADSAIRIALRDLESAVSRESPEAAAREKIVRVFDRDIPVLQEREVGRIDLNSANELLLAAAFAGNGVDEAEAWTLAQRIIDWRDPDDVRSGTTGAERAEYRAVGRASGPRNGPFEVVAELRDVMGAERLPANILAAFTVHSQVPTVLQAAASPFALNALRWADERRIDERRWQAVESAVEAPVMHGEALRLRACAEVGRVEVCRAATVRLTGHPRRPLVVQEWETRYEG